MSFCSRVCNLLGGKPTHDEDEPAELKTDKNETEMKREREEDEADEEDDDIIDMPEFDPKNRYQQKSRRVSVCAEPFNPDEAAKEAENKRVVIPKTQAETDRLFTAVKDILIFKSLEESQLKEVIEAIEKRNTSPGEVIITQGDEDADNFYVIDSGVFAVFVTKDGVENEVFKYDNKGSFGELALLYDQPRAATVKATTDGVIWALDRSTFRRIVLLSAHQRRTQYERFLGSMPILSSLQDYERQNLADALVSRYYNDGEEIIAQGSTDSECMFFVEEGEVNISAKSAADPTGEAKKLKVCQPGDYFGELALLTKKPRAASAYASGRTKLAHLDVGAFERLLGPCMEVMQRNMNEYEEVVKAQFGMSLNDLQTDSK